MARYIDADIEVSDYVTVWDCDCSEFGRQTVMSVDDLQYLPTADVVPKGEYDAVVSAVDNSTKDFLKLHDDYQKAKREVDRLKYNLKAVLEEIPETKRELASEIFAEIERLLDLNCLQGDIFIGKYFDVDLKNDIAELKKKYTEETK
jgi:hypothetical protein